MNGLPASCGFAQLPHHGDGTGPMTSAVAGRAVRSHAVTRHALHIGGILPNFGTAATTATFAQPFWS